MASSQNRDTVKVAFNKAPAQVQEALSDGLAANFITQSQSRFNLHIDAVAILAALVRDLLIGLENPQGFFNQLRALVGDERAHEMLRAFNTEVLLPLREQEKTGGVGKPSTDIHSPFLEDAAADSSTAPEIPKPQPATKLGLPLKPVAIAPTTPPVPPPAAYTPPAPTIVMPPTPAPYIPPAPSPAPAVAMPPQPVASAPAVPEHPQMRTMATDMQAVKEHRPVEPFYMEHHAPTVAPPPAPAPRPAAPQPAAYVPPAPQAPEAPRIAPVRPTPPPPSNLPGAPVVHEYSVDPYREPVE